MNYFAAAPLLSGLKLNVRRAGLFAAVAMMLFASSAAAQEQQIVIDFPVAGAGAAPYLGNGSPMIGPGGTLRFHLTQDARVQSVTFDPTFDNVRELTIAAVRGCTQGVGAGVTAAGTACSVDYFLGPVFSGLRERAGTLRVVTSTGTYTAGVAFTVTGPQVAFTPGTISTLTLDPSKGTASSFALDGAGNRYITLPAAGLVEKVDAETGATTLVAGNGTFTVSGDGGPATAAGVPDPMSVAVAPSGDIYIVSNDTNALNQAVRKVDAQTGLISTVYSFASHGKYGNVAADRNGYIYVASPYNGALVQVSPSGGVQLLDCFTGHDPYGNPFTPTAIALDGNGHIFFASNNRVLRSDLPPGNCINVVEVAGAGGANGYSGDGGPAYMAEMGLISGLAVNAAGDVYLADATNNVVRKVVGGYLGNAITTVAGTGVGGDTGDGGPATSATLQGVNGYESLALDPEGNLYVLDTVDNVVRKVAVHHASLTFLDTNLGDTSAGQLVTVDNIGAMDLTLTAPTNGTNPSVTGGFVLGAAGTCPVLPDGATPTIAVGASCTQEVKFLPLGAGGITGTLTVQDNAGGSEVGVLAQSVALSGNGKAVDTHPAGITLLSPSAVDFGTVPAGTVSNSWTVNVSNTGAVATKISAIFLSDAYDFKETTNCGTVLAAYSSCQVLVSFSPQTTGYLTATLEVDDDLAPYHQKISLSGNATGTAVQLAPSSISFGNVTQYTTANPYTVNVSNTGGSAVKISAVFLSDPYNFRETTNCGAVLAAYSSCQVLVSFAPTKVGYLASTLEVDDDAAPYHLTIPLDGTGQATVGNYSVSVTPAALSLKAGETGTAAFTFMPEGGFTGAVTFACSGLPSGAACNFAPATLMADGSNKAQVSQLSVTTSGIFAQHAMNEKDGGSGWFVPTVFGLNGLLVGFVFVRQRVKPVAKTLMLLVLLGGLGAVSGCGAGILGGSTLAGTNMVTVTATAATLTTSGTATTQTTSFTLTITQ